MPLVPEYEALLAELAAAEGPAIADLSPAEGREMYRMMRPANPDIAVGAVADTTLPGSAGPVPVRVYTPEGDGPFPVFVNFHGGGWVIGDLDTADAVCRDICRTAGCVVVSVDYRLAPEHPFPAAVEDACAAVAWVADNMGQLQGNGRLAVGGESAGGNLAAVACQWARDRGGPEIHFQLLLYPVVDHDMERASYRENGAGYMLELDTMRWFWDHYCPDPARRTEPQASPLRAADLSNLPPALVVTAEFDPLRDEGEAYAAALAAAGTEAEAVRYDGLVHDFFATAALFEPSRRGFEAACKALRERLTV
ncbi:MAG: alpha/beta hydrolase fold domain-containing protein [Gammaproteobacteria bacterium]|jgi:acetyl esterase|nr:alpha/beta hydrolase fold domain-containing protein [Gammaproteobacteria bacterium]